MKQFLSVLLDENLSQKDYIKYIENKFVENIGLLYREKIFLNENTLLKLYFLYIHAYLNYANSACGSIIRKKFKNLFSQQKHAIQL